MPHIKGTIIVDPAINKGAPSILEDGIAGQYKDLMDQDSQEGREGFYCTVKGVINMINGGCTDEQAAAEMRLSLDSILLCKEYAALYPEVLCS